MITRYNDKRYDKDRRYKPDDIEGKINKKV